MHILDFFIFQTTEAENPPAKGPNICANICTFLGLFMLIVFMAASVFVVIAGGNAAKRLESIEENERLHDREILRSMYVKVEQIMEDISK